MNGNVLRSRPKGVPSRSGNSSGIPNNAVIPSINAKSIRKAYILRLKEANGRFNALRFTSAPSAQDSTSMITRIALSPFRFSLYLPVGVCSMKVDRVRRWKLSLPVSIFRAFNKSVNEHSPFSCSMYNTSLRRGCESTDSIFDTLASQTVNISTRFPI